MVHTYFKEVTARCCMHKLISDMSLKQLNFFCQPYLIFIITDSKNSDTYLKDSIMKVTDIKKESNFHPLSL